MKCIFTLAGSNSRYVEMTKVLVASAYHNTNLDLYCLYDGNDAGFIAWLKKWGVTVLPWRVTFFDDIYKHYKGNKSFQFCVGTYLCTEIPWALRYYGILDRYVLYVDTDTMILNDVFLDHHTPSYYAAPPDWDITDWSFVSAGVMLLNTDKLLESYPAFLDYLKDHNFDFDFAGHGGADQGAWNTFYADLWDKLEPKYDWKPWWGFNPEASIVHFSGPKPQDLPDLLNDPFEHDENPLTRKINVFVVNQDLDAFKRYLHIWRKYRMITVGAPRSKAPNRNPEGDQR